MLKFQFARSLKQFLMSTCVVLGFVVFVFYQRLVMASTHAQNYDNRIVFPPEQATSQVLPGGYKDGIYMGVAVAAGYGQVQVKAIVQNGRISGVEFVDYPYDRQTSQQINAQAMPLLQLEAIQAQGANVNMISGATLTSKAFVDSLQSALQFARN